MICHNCTGPLDFYRGDYSYSRKKCRTCGYTIVLGKKYMIKYEEINPKGLVLTDEQEANIKILLEKMNIVREKYTIPMTVTSGIRTIDEQVAIYKDKAARKLFPFTDGNYDESKVPLKSKHLYGQAIDILDHDKTLYNWCKANEDFLAETGLWMEERQGNWVHFQIVAYRSWCEGKSRWFNP